MFQVSKSWRHRLLLAAGFAVALAPFTGDMAAQQAPADTTPALLHQPTDPRLQGFRWRSIGPTGQGGRIDDIAVDEKNPSTFYLGFAVSGLWKTTNNGTTFESIFDEYNHSIGDIALAPSNANIIYVGTGEPNNRQTSSFGDGVYKSTDAGKTWTHMGLRETQSIGRILVHPRNPDIAWVAAVGHLFGPNEERGVFMTTDGGKTWSKTLYINQDTGATDLVMDPSNPNLLFASTYERRRTSWGFVGGGPGSGIHQSTDGGKTWKKVTGGGLPRGTMGRIAMDFSRSNPNVLYAQIEVAADKEPAPAPGSPEAEAIAAAAAQGGRGGGGGGRGGAQAAPDPTLPGVWRSADKGKTWTFQSNENQRPMYFSQIRVDPNNENTLFAGGVGPRKSLDAGKTWSNLPNMGHVDNHAIWIDPNNSQHVMYGNDGGLDVTWDQGDTWESVRMWAVGLPYYVSVDMRRPYNVCTGLQDNGSWCGPSGQRSGDIYMWNWLSVGGGDGFQTAQDPNDPNIFYTESQNGNITRYDLNTGTTANIRPRIGGAARGGGGGGRGGGSNVLNEPPADDVMQFNWNSPIRISPHNPNTILFAGRHFFVSRNRGDSWTMGPVMGKGIDLSQRTILEQPYNLPSCGRGAGPGVDCILSKHDGYVNNEYGTVVELEESPVVPGIYWVGTDDGNLQVSLDGGNSWAEVGKNIPGGTREYHISGIEASKFDAATAYVSLDGHRNNDHAPYVYKTTDNGKTWTSIAGDLPRGNVNSIRQDPVAKNLLYAPAEYGFYISLNEGTNWMKFMPNLPNVRVDDVLVHPRDNDLVLATHGRSVWVMDDITSLQQMAMAAPTAPTLYQPRDAVQWKTDRRNQTEVPGSKFWKGDNMPRGTAIAYYLPSITSNVLVTITNTATGAAVRTCTADGNAGLNRFQWTLNGDAPAGGGGRGGRAGQAAPAPAAPTGPTPCVPPAGGGGRGFGGGGRGGFGGGGIGPGVYKVTLSVAGAEVGSQTFSILEDIWLNQK